MRTTLFFIPTHLFGWPLLGDGLLLAVVAVVGVVVLALSVRRHGLNGETLGQLPLFVLLAVIVRVVLPELARDNPGVPIRGFGVTLLLGVAAGVWLAVERAERRGLAADVVYNLAVWMFAAGMLGARLFYVVEYWDQYRHDSWLETLLAVVNVAQGGLVVYGSLLGALGAFYLFARRERLPALALADLIAPSMLVGLAIGRIGCFLNGCCFGGVCDLPWAVTFPATSPPYVRQLERGQKTIDVDALYGLTIGRPTNDPRIADLEALAAPVVTAVRSDSLAARAGLQVDDRIVSVSSAGDERARTTPTVQAAYEAIANQFLRQRVAEVQTGRGRVTLPAPALAADRSLPVHPTQLYSVFDAALICLLLLAYEPFQRRDGELLALMLSVYAVTRFLIEQLRSDEAAVFGTSLTISQNISLVILVLMSGFWWWLRRGREGRAWSTTESEKADLARAI